MADIDALIAGAGKTNANFDFNSIINKPAREAQDAAFKAQDQDAKNVLRDAFKNGVPTTADGSPDFGAMAKTLFQKGGLDQGVAASNLGIQRDQLKLGQDISAKMGNLEGGGAVQPTQPQQPIVSPPSMNRGASTAVAPPLNKGGVGPSQDGQPPQGAPQGQQPTVMTVLAAQGIPNDQLGAASASIARQLGVDPTAPLNVLDPQVRNVLVPAIQQLKRMGAGQVAQPGQPQQQDIPPVNPQQNQGTFGAPPATPTRGAIPTGTDPEIQKQIATYTAIASNPAFPKATQEAALARLKALQDQGQPTPDIKNYDLYRRQGGDLKFNEWQADNEAKKTAATEEAKLNSTKYQQIVENGTKAQQEIPQLRMLQEQMNDPNFYSGVGEKYTLLYKRLKSAVGIDPDAAVPQEFLRKATAANVLSSLGALKGLGQIRVAEINMAREAASSPDNSVPANKLLTEISIRTHQRNSDIADLAQAYKEKNGALDAGFDKIVTQYGREHPLFTDPEIKDWGLSLGRAAKGQQQTAAGPQQFASPDAVHAAVAAGKLKKGDTFLDSSGKSRMVP